MPFNIALSGIRAANDDLRITGNNIANASTTGFKESRAEFGDVYSNTVLGAGLNQLGSGVRVQDVSQQFTQGNIKFTENVLDMAVNGLGFFVLNTGGDVSYTRAGAFGLDQDGFVTNNTNGRLQGYVADSTGLLSDLPTDILIETTNIEPQATTQVNLNVRLNSSDDLPQTGFIIPAARVGEFDDENISIGITNADGNETLVAISTAAAAGDDTAATIRAALNNAIGVSAEINTAGDIEIVLQNGFRVTNNPTVNLTPAGTSDSLTFAATTSFETAIGFDPTDQMTYNYSTAVEIYDSLGNPHTMQQYFMKQPYDPSDPTTANMWQMAVLINGNNVGAPTNPADPVNTAQLAVFDLHFTPSGVLDEVRTGDIAVTNWEPLDANGDPTNAFGPNDVPTSNFDVFLTGSTQVSGNYEVRSADQDGTATGRLAGISIEDEGFIFARYTNGQDRVIARVALADFPNSQGLQPTGDTAWVETFASGEALVGPPGTSSLGLVQSGGLEESNVDLSEQLVNLIIAQRNFQASAKTIETADQTTQTIINLR